MFEVSQNCMSYHSGALSFSISSFNIVLSTTDSVEPRANLTFSVPFLFLSFYLLHTVNIDIDELG